MLSAGALRPGIAPRTTDSPARAPVGGPVVEPRPLSPGSPLARAVYEVWTGRPVTVIDAPPGSGKSSLIGDTVAHLHSRTDLTIEVGAFTREAAVAVAGRIAALVGPGIVVLSIRSWPNDQVPDDVLRWDARDHTRRHIEVNTLASFARRPTRPAVDVMVIDEAYQSTFELASAAAQVAEQVLLVGDPGQIGPVVTADTSAWDLMPAGPHQRAPQVFATYPDVASIHLPCTYRLGKTTVDVIAPLYDFTFTSARPDRHLVGHREIESVTVPATGDPYSVATARIVAERAAHLAAATLSTAGGAQPLTTRDVAVVVSHNAQQSAVEAHLADMGLVGITVGTADRLQGGQWHAVVALDPLTGKDGLSQHALSSGRLCVMTSRHMTHLSWVHDGGWRQSLTEVEGLDPAEVAKGLRVRRRIERASEA